MVMSDNFENAFASHFREAYESEVDEVFDQWFFTNETFYSHPVYHDFTFFGSRVQTKNEWWFFLDETEGIQMNINENYMFFKHNKIHLKADGSFELPKQQSKMSDSSLKKLPHDADYCVEYKKDFLDVSI